MQKEIDKQVYLLKKVTKERDDTRSELNESQQSVRGLFNEQKRLESQMDRMKDEVSRSTKAVDKMRDETIRLRSKVNELHHEKSDLKKQHDSHIADEEAEAAERVTVLADLRSLLERRNQQLNDWMKRWRRMTSIGPIHPYLVCVTCWPNWPISGRRLNRRVDPFLRY
jgi:myosin heavy subunit